MWAVSDADGLVEMFVNQDAALCERDAKVRGADLKDPVLIGDGVVLVDGSFGLNREDEIEVQMGWNRDESGTFLLRGFCKSFVKIGDEIILEKAVGRFECFDAVKSELVGKPSLKSLVHPFTSAPGLGRVGWDHSDPEVV